jgi:hypothetical protein
MTMTSVRTVYAIPLVLSLITITGLIAALLGDGLWDAISWTLLALPIALLCYFLFLPRR